MIGKVLFICQRDWANHSYIMTQCLKTVGVDSIAVTTHQNKIDYPQHALLCKDPEELNRIVDEADIIIFMHSQFIGTNVDLHKKKVLVFHTGTKYRQRPAKMNSLFDPIVDVTLTAADTFDLGGKNEKYVVVPIDIHKIQPIYNTNNSKLVIGHYPTGYKGRDIIEHVIQSLPNSNFEYRFSNIRVPWVDQIDRMSKCDVYIEDLCPKQKNKSSSGFGLTAIEAAALGKIVISRVTYSDKYEKEIGPLGIQIANDEEDLRRILKNLLSFTPSKILELKMNSRKWAETCHSYEAVGNMFKKIFEDLYK